MLESSKNNNYNKLEVNQRLSNNTITKIVKNADNITKLISLNNYVDK